MSEPKQHTVEELQEFLNYDTYTESFLSYFERIRIHKAIIQRLKWYRHDPFDFDLQWKLSSRKDVMITSGWEPTEVRFVQRSDNKTEKVIINK